MTTKEQTWKILSSNIMDSDYPCITCKIYDTLDDTSTSELDECNECAETWQPGTTPPINWKWNGKEYNDD